MSLSYSTSIPLPAHPLSTRLNESRLPLSMHLELTARCNLDCRQCYVNLPAGDRAAKAKELTRQEINDIADQAVAAGTIWCTLSGGDPLLRRDFADIYVDLKKKGLILSIYTNACLLREEHIRLLRQYPPHVVDVTVYGATQETYEAVTRTRGGFAAFRRGVDLLLHAGIRVSLKGTMIRSNAHELAEIAEYAKDRSCEPFTFDSVLFFRVDRDPVRNQEIQSERLSPQEVTAIEAMDKHRTLGFKSEYDELCKSDRNGFKNGELFYCKAGVRAYTVTWDGKFSICTMLRGDHFEIDLRKQSLSDAWNGRGHEIRETRVTEEAFDGHCQSCSVSYLCHRCPAHSAMESGRLDSYSKYVCDLTMARVGVAQGAGPGPTTPEGSEVLHQEVRAESRT